MRDDLARARLLVLALALRASLWVARLLLCTDRARRRKRNGRRLPDRRPVTPPTPFSFLPLADFASVRIRRSRRWSTDKPQDVIWEPALELIQATNTSVGRMSYRSRRSGAIFTNNPIFNHGDYRIQDRLALTADTSLLLRYRYVPNLFLGPNFERRTGTRSIQEERVSSHTWRAEVERRVSESITAALIGRYGLRLYNESFAERDTTFWTVGPRVGYRATNWMMVTLSYLYERGLADGRQETQFMDDVSYYLHMLSVSTELHLHSRFNLELTLYSSPENIYERYRRGHSSESLRLYAPGNSGGSVSSVACGNHNLAYQYGKRTSTTVLRDFSDSIVSIGVEYRF